jgi:type IX secretion system PorP/SprF family membrane protein
MYQLLIKGKLVLLAMIVARLSFAQDAHLSQYDAMPMMINPANTAMGDVDEMRIGLQYRSQWASMGNNFLTTAATFELPYGDRFGFGASILAYNAADVFSTLNFLVSGSYLISDPSQRNWRLSTGLQIGFLYNRINMNELLFENQFDGQNFDPDLPSGEFLERRSTFAPDANIGIVYENTNDRKKINPHAGFSLYHVTRPNEHFTGERSKKPLRYVGHIGARINLSRDFYIDPRILYMRQRNAQEIMFGAMANVELRQPYALVFGAFYRNKDAAIIHAGVQHNKNVYRISYDVNTSGLSDATNNRGAIEISVLYTPGRKRRNRF